MCGILGGINTRFDADSLATLRHRGPDQELFTTEPRPGGGVVAMGQTRLNVVDRDDIDLPVRIGPSSIVFNGEIYNWIELRQELLTHGWSFRTRTDTEVVLAAYLQWGPECLVRFNGMFAFVIWDGERFFAARDRLGQKPLYYRRLPTDRFELASEVKAFADLELVGSEVFDLFEFCFDEHTLFRDVYSVRPGSYLIYDPASEVLTTETYWDIERADQDRRLEDPEIAIDRFIELLEDAVRLRLRADVDVSLFLSGGLDSALLARCSGVARAFTCQFTELQDSIDEELYARDLAGRLGISLEVLRPQRDDFLRDLPFLAHHLEIPTGSLSVFPLSCLARAARAAGYKVVLSGEGADELFAGYVRNELLVFEPPPDDDPKHRAYREVLARFRGSDLDRFCRMASRSGLEGAAEMKRYLADSWRPDHSMVDNLCYVESRVFLQPLLQMADRMTMAHGVEARCPYLDHRLVELAFTLDDSLRCRDGTGKWIVHRAAERLLPKGSLVLERPVKHGLATPVNLWTRGRHDFDRSHWNSMMMAECRKSLVSAVPSRT